MYKIKTSFDFPMSHRLSKHDGKCKNLHGHNFKVIVCVRAEELDKNDMVMDFSDLKEILKPIEDSFDHSMVLNETDVQLKKNIEACLEGFKIVLFPYDPTAEKLAEGIFKTIDLYFDSIDSDISVDYVEVFENERSSALYSE
jgi:6-pyruvoyltetrahydropterin/6-carboxytetrahydropterin synthase